MRTEIQFWLININKINLSLLSAALQKLVLLSCSHSLLLGEVLLFEYFFNIF